MEQEQTHELERFQLNQLPRELRTGNIASDVYQGLTSTPRSLPPKYFYDGHGSWLFDQICQTEEYYLTRAEAGLLEQYGNEIIAIARPDAIVEFGSGTADKTELLIRAANDHCDTLHYLPVDVCREILLDSGKRLTNRYPWLSIDAWHGDFLNSMRDIENDHERSLYSFLGSSLGNFSREEALDLLREIRAIANHGDWFLLGVDMLKDTDTLNAAYNDSAGFTAAFNLNVLNVLNRTLGGDFDTDKFRHHAFFDTDRSRIEMQLRSCCRQRVNLADIGLGLEFGEDEYIITEYSRKYTAESIRYLLESVGFFPRYIYSGENNEFMLVLSSCTN